jgi:hypothetical protein
VDAAGALEIARRSRGTPRIANRLLRRVRDYAQVKGSGAIDSATADLALAMLDVDPQGFDLMDRKLLEAVIHRFDGGPVGLDNVAAAIGEEPGTIEDVIEPYLIQQGYLQRTPRGRIATLAAYRHLGLAPPQRAGDLFGGAAVRDEPDAPRDQRSTSWYQKRRRRGESITGLTREPSIAELRAFGAPITKGTWRVVPSAASTSAMPATGLGGRPPPASTLPAGAGAEQRHRVALGDAQVGAAAQAARRRRPVGAEVGWPPIVTAALTTFSPVASAM